MTVVDDRAYERRVRAWVLYDWANSAFATTVLSAVLPVYYGRVAGATLPSLAVATSYWTTGLSISLLLVAVLSPILGTVSDVMRGKKKLLSIAMGLGVVATGLLVLVDRGDWMLASILFVLGRVGFASANVFYDALLPHVAREEDQDKVSTRGYATGYLGGGILLAINAVMIFVFPGTWGTRLSFVTVAIWWALFTIPLLRHVPEPGAALQLPPGRSVLKESFTRLGETFRNLKRYRELAKFLVAFLIYNDGIGTIIAVAAIYMTALRFEPMQIILALLLVQFVGIPFSLIFGRIPNPKESRRARFLAFVLFNVVALPVIGIAGARMLPLETTGAAGTPFAARDGAVGERETLYEVSSGDAFVRTGFETVPRTSLGEGAHGDYVSATGKGARLEFPYHGQDVEIVFARQPGGGAFAVEIDGKPVVPDDRALVVETEGDVERYEEVMVVEALGPGVHRLALVTQESLKTGAVGVVTLRGVRVLPRPRASNLGLILGLLLGLQVVAAAFAFLLGPVLFSRLVTRMDTKATILLSITVYAGIALWAFFLDSVIEFWCLAWMVAVVQGGSQALSRSLYARMAPRTMSGEFFGFFTIMSKFSAILGPLLFTFAIAAFGSTRPAVLSVVFFFLLGGALLLRVDTEEGQRVAKEADLAGGHPPDQAP